LNPLDANLRQVGDASVIDRFIDRLIGVAVFGVFANHGNADLGLWIAQLVQQLAPVIQVQLAG
jgi:hypothetical protein